MYSSAISVLHLSDAQLHVLIAKTQTAPDMLLSLVCQYTRQAETDCGQVV